MRTTATEKRFFARADEKLTAFLDWKWRFALVGELPRQAGEIFPKLPDMKTSIPLVLVTFALVCFALVQNVQAVVPAPDGGYPGGNTAEGQNALFGLTTGTYNTAAGIYSLLSLTVGNFCTGIGAGTLLANTADQNTAIGAGALLNNTTGGGNTANGAFALFSNIAGFQNTANGAGALLNNTTGNYNTALGLGALESNTTADNNTALGINTLLFNSTGFQNTACGGNALEDNTIGGDNTATGFDALFNDTTGSDNTANGDEALFNNTTGSSNTAIGEGALANCTTGTGNVALGVGAGANVTTAHNVICIGDGVAGENTEDSTCFIGNIFEVTTSGGIGVFVNFNGKLGTVPSSRRFKDGIKPMENASEILFALKPVSFHYKKEIDSQRIPQFGLVAEEVEKVNPDLIVRDKEGKPYSVRYDQVNAMLLNEFLKEHKKTEKLEATVAQLKSGMEALTATVKEQAAQIQKVSAQLAAASPSRGGLEASEAAPQVVNNDQ